MDALGVALVGGLAGGTIAAIIGGIVTLRAQGRQHAHELEMARQARVQDRRAAAYEAALEHGYRIEAWVARTLPIIGFENDPKPPEQLPDEAMFRLNALSAAHASPQVKDLARAMTKAAVHFQSRAWMVQAEREHPTERRSGWEELEAARSAYRDALTALGEQINRELGT